MPDLECHADEQARIDQITLDADHSDVSDVYRIKGGNLSTGYRWRATMSDLAA